MTAKKAPERKKQRIKRKPPRKQLKLTRVEAEIMFTIWKSETSLGYKAIADQHAARFGGPKKPIVTVRGIIHDIKRLQEATGRKYLDPSGGVRGEYNIDRKNFVNLQRTAVILLEVSRGYKHIDREILRERFEQYIFETYGWDKDFISGRVEYARRSHYIAFTELTPGKQYIEIENRLDHDVDYFILLVEDYCLEQEREDPHAPIVSNLTKLITQCHAGETARTNTGGNT